MCIVYKASFAPIQVGLWTLVEWNLHSKTVTQNPFCAVCIPFGDLWRNVHNIGVNFISSRNNERPMMNCLFIWGLRMNNAIVARFWMKTLFLTKSSRSVHSCRKRRRTESPRAQYAGKRLSHIGLSWGIKIKFKQRDTSCFLAFHFLTDKV